MTRPWRRRTLGVLIAAFLVPLCLGLIVAGFFAYSWLFQLSDTEPVSLRHTLGLITAMGAGVFVGYGLSFGAWLLVARYLLRFGREDVEPMFSGVERPPIFGRLFQALFERCYGPRT